MNTRRETKYKVEGMQINIQRAVKIRVTKRPTREIMKEILNKLHPRPKESQEQEVFGKEKETDGGEKNTEDPEEEAINSSIASTTRREAERNATLSPKKRGKRRVQAMKRDK